MKHSFILSLVLSLMLQSNAFAQANSCGLTTEEADALNLATGMIRLKILSNATTYLENPTLFKPVGDPANSDSVAMYSLTEMYGASEAAANESEQVANEQEMSDRCNDQKAMDEAKINGTLQLYAQACIVYSLINRVVDLISEKDLLEKQLIEDKATMNKSSAENAKREAEVAKKKAEMQEVNKKIKAAITKIEKAKEALEKAKEALESAKKSLEAANAITCPEDDDGSCASSKAEAVAAAQKAVDDAQKKVDDAKKKLDAAVKELIDYMVDKLGVETGAILALLSGTTRGETDGGSVSFKVSSSEYTLADVGDIIKNATGTDEERANAFINDDDVSQGTMRFFQNLIGSYDLSEERDHADIHNVDATGSSAMYYGVLGLNNSEANREILEILSSTENGIDNLLTLAAATQDYKEQYTGKQIAALEAQKTPQSRMDEMGRKMDEKNEQVEKLKTMITKNICYLDSNLNVFKTMFKETSQQGNNLSSTQSQTSTTFPVPQDPFYVYLNGFKTDKLTKKANEGYFSKINYKGIQNVVQCYAKGGNATSCSAAEKEAEQEPKDVANSCHWSGPVFGPSAPVTSPVCDQSKVGQTTENDSGNILTCKCQ